MVAPDGGAENEGQQQQQEAKANALHIDSRGGRRGDQRVAPAVRSFPSTADASVRLRCCCGRCCFWMLLFLLTWRPKAERYLLQ